MAETLHAWDYLPPSCQKLPLARTASIQTICPPTPVLLIVNHHNSFVSCPKQKSIIHQKCYIMEKRKTPHLDRSPVYANSFHLYPSRKNQKKSIYTDPPFIPAPKGIKEIHFY